MKDKTIAAMLAFFGGIVGLHRFYLGEKGLGIAHVFLFAVAASAGPSTFIVMLLSLAVIFGIINAISFLSMDRKEFDLKYNKTAATSGRAAKTSGRNTKNQKPMNDRERRFQERQRQRAAREQERERRDRERFNQRPNTNEAGTPTYRVKRADAGSAEREAGVRYFKDYEYGRAIKAFQKALEKNPRDVASHFNIACAYSVEEDPDQAFYHLDRAVALGFDDFGRIRNHDNLAFLRVQTAYPSFEKNNFRLVAEPQTEEFATADPLVTETAETQETPLGDDLLEQLQRLAILRDKGLLTQGEFVAQKRRLLG